LRQIRINPALLQNTWQAVLIFLPNLAKKLEFCWTSAGLTHKKTLITEKNPSGGLIN
jgi:hypothetical protein